MPNSFSVAVVKHKAVVAWRDCLGDSPEDLLRILANFISFYRGINEYSCMEARA